MGNSSEVLGRIPRPMVDGYLTYGGNVTGNATNNPMVVNYFPYNDWAVDKQDVD